MVLDAGVILNLLEGEKEEVFNKIVRGEITPIISEISLFEVFYIICRVKGETVAENLIRKLVESGFYSVSKPSWRILREAASLKCSHAISLADCVVIATAKAHRTVALFNNEEELRKNRIDNVILI